MTEMTRKSVVSPVGDDPLTFVMSDESVDRDGDVIDTKGWRLSNFAKNPIALFNHRADFVIGHWTDVKVQGAKLVGRLNLLPEGISERLDEIRAAVKAGVLRAVSVGFVADPDKVERNAHGGFNIRGAELMECSLVSVPANPNALQMAKSLNLSDDVQSLIFAKDDVGDSADDPEIQPALEPAASGTKVRVVKLGDPARVGAKPSQFVIRKIHRTA